MEPQTTWAQWVTRAGEADQTDAGVGPRLGFPEAEAVVKAQAAVEKAGDGLRSLFPREWLAPSALGLQLWQWLAIPLLVVLVAIATVLLGKLSTVLLLRLAQRTRTEGDDKIVGTLAGPLKLWWAALLVRLLLPLLSLSEGVEAGLQRAGKVALGLAFFWGVLAAVSAWTEHFAISSFAQARPGSRALVNLIGRIAKVALVALAVLATLSELGYSVTSVLAGLGLGGLALALGAQKTLENVFGAFALAVDQPFREGDFVRVEDFVGTVETIGLRSTRIRTLDRTLITIPNGKLADLRTETFAARDRIRLFATVNLVHGTTAAQLREVVAGFHEVLKAQPKLWPDSRSVHLMQLGSSSLDVEVMAWFVTTDFDEFKAIREAVLFGFLEVVEKAGTRLAVPARAVHLAPGVVAPAKETPPAPTR
jgi:MscS family membrane protein